MPARARRAAPAAAEVVEPEEDREPSAPGLQFNEPLSWRAGKPIAVADLLRRLQALHHELRELDQEEDIRDSLAKVAKELAHTHLLAHKDKGVRAWAGCCLVDILRLCAPAAPYTGEQLRDIFTMLITSILPSLSDASNAYNNQHMYVLQSLEQVKSIALVTDLPSSEALMTHLFINCFDIIAGSSKSSTGERVAKAVEVNMTNILVMVVDEAAVLPNEAVDSIIAQFLRTDPRVLGGQTRKSKKGDAAPAIDEKQTTLSMKELPPAYNMAKTVCNSCPEKMAREISQYFLEVITEATSTAGKSKSGHRDSVDMDDIDLGPSEDELKELEKAHKLLRELWRACPGVLLNVIPQLEAELSAENVQLRKYATETLGDIVSGIGAAGPPPPTPMDPAAYPPVFLANSSAKLSNLNVLTVPASPQPFPQAHPHAYQSYLGRRHDKSPLIRAAWTIGVGRILTTSAGGVGLGQDEEHVLLECLSRMLNDSDEKVRLAAVKAVGTFSLRDIVIRLGALGSVAKSGSVLANLAARVRDKKTAVRNEAMRVLGRMWGIAAGEIANGNEQVIDLLGGAPSKILDAYYANELEINVTLDHVIFEYLLPLSYPPFKSKASKLTNGNSQRVKDSQANGDDESVEPDPDSIRTERILLLAKGLDERAKRVFYMYQLRQAVLSKYMTAYLVSAEEYNTGVVDKDLDKVAITERLTKVLNEMAKFFPDASKASSDLWKFAKMNDRRSFQLIRFCIAPDSDYRTLFKAFKELTKRVESAPNSTGLLDTLIPLLYRSSIIVYNKSHIPPLMAFSRSDNKVMVGVAQDILQDISARTPEVLKGHIQEMCRVLQDDAPSSSRTNSASAVDSLKACAGFARRFPKEIPQDRKFVQAMTNFALHGSPAETAKHAVSIIMAASEKKEIVAKDLVHQCVKNFTFGKGGFLSRLAALSQLWLLAPTEIDDDGDAVIDIAIKEVLLKVRSPSKEPGDAYSWSETLDEECEAKCWALKILVNRLRSHEKPSTLAEVTQPIYTLLDTLISKEGELSSSPTNLTPATHKPRLRLLAARLYLKLSTLKNHEALLSAKSFNKLAEVAQDGLLEVRQSFVNRLTKYLATNKIPQRFFTIMFLLAFEPDKKFKSDSMVWIRSRVAFFRDLRLTIGGNGAIAADPAGVEVRANKSVARAQTVLEGVFARLISLLAYHPDYPSSSEEFEDFARYILFYLDTVANNENISLIYHIAQSIKGCQDAISGSQSSKPRKSLPKSEQDIERDQEQQDADDMNTHLYALSDLAQLTIRSFEDARSLSIQTLPTLAKLSLPRSLFKEIRNHDEALRVAEQSFLPDADDLIYKIDTLVRKKPSTASKKRKSDALADGDEEAKKMRKLSIRDGRPKSSIKANVGKKRVASGATKKKASKTWRSDEEEEDEDEAPAKGRLREEAKERRKSGRSGAVVNKSYVERDSSEDEAELEELNRETQELDEEEDEVSEAEDERDEALDPEAEAEDVEMSDALDDAQDDAKDASDQDSAGADEEPEPEPPSSTKALRSRRPAKAQPTSKPPAKTPPKPTAKKATPKSKSSPATSKEASASKAKAKGKSKPAVETPKRPTRTSARQRASVKADVIEEDDGEAARNEDGESILSEAESVDMED